MARAQGLLDVIGRRLGPPFRTNTNGNDGGRPNGPIDNGTPVGGVDDNMLAGILVPNIPEGALVREIPDSDFDADVHADAGSD